MKKIINFSPFFSIAVIFLTAIARILLPLPVLILYGLRINGKKNLRTIGKSGAITVSNHCQIIEPLFTGLSVWPKRIWYAAEENNVTRRDIGWLSRRLGAFGIPDDNPMLIAGAVRDALRKGHLVHFYPEGALYYRNQNIKPFHNGAFFFALLFNVPVIPMTEVLLDRPIRKILPFIPPRVRYIISAPVFPASFRSMQMGRKERIQYMADFVHRRMTETIKKNGGCRELPERIEEREDIYAAVN